jgi:hypothetical protein
MKSDPKSSITYPPEGSDKPVDRRLLNTLVGLQLFIALCGLLASGEKWPSSSATIAMLLAILLFSRERFHDERVDHLKLKAISYGLATGLFTASFLNLGWKFLRLTSPRLTLSAFEVLILIQLIALSLFHYWRWQDGREKA